MGEVATAPVKEGDILAGRYRVEKVLAAGGMGVVVAAKHVTLGQRVALKFLLSSLPATDEVGVRFEREARSAALLTSEHVARVIDVGKLETGAPYMVMEYLDGCDLATLVEQEGRLGVAMAVDYLLQTCEGLAEAHKARIVHRDLKPSNLFRASRPDGSALIKILDFGISKADDASNASVTSTAAVLGSPLYMSPEQMQSSKAADARSDIWSLGVVLYQLLTRRLPFEEETMPGLCVAIVTRPPHRLAEHIPDVPPELEQVVARCLQKAPDDRFQNVAELASALAPFAPDSRAQVERVRRVLLGASSQATSSSDLPRIQVDLSAQTQTDPFGRTKTALAGSTSGATTQAPHRSNVWIIAGAVVVGLAVVGGIAVKVTSSAKAGPDTTAAAASNTTPAIVTPPAPTTTTTAIATTTMTATDVTAATSTDKHPTGQHTNVTTPAAHASTSATAKSSATSAAPAMTGFSSDRK